MTSPALSPSRPTFRRDTRPHRPLTAELVQTWADSPELWLDRIEHVDGDRWYLELDADERTTVWLISWAPGTGIDLHDHGDATGSLLVVEGQLSERYTGRHREGGLRHRELHTGRLVSFGRDHVHEVRNRSDRPAVSLHVYAPSLDSMGFYAEDGGTQRPRLLERRSADDGRTAPPPARS